VHQVTSTQMRTTAVAQGTANLVGGLWALLSMRSFEAVFGPKYDRWLVRTVAGLLVATGWTLLRTPADPAALVQARRLGTGTAATLLTIDLVYVSAGRIRWTYLIDAVTESAWLAAWMAAGGPDGSGAPRAASARPPTD